MIGSNVMSHDKTMEIQKLIEDLPTMVNEHAPGSEKYDSLKSVVRKEIEELFSSTGELPGLLKPFGWIVFPYFQMGYVTSINLFDLDELIIFSFYWINRSKYKAVLDIGANIGLHSIVLDKCGYEVRCFEPDPALYEQLEKNLKLNDCKKVMSFNAAISSEEGELEFTRVCGNLTGSHLTGSKSDPYGELEKFPVKVESFHAHLTWADLVKMDAEGHEKEILLSTTKRDWAACDALVEIENEENAKVVFNHFKKCGVNLFSQKTNWQKVDDIKGMPSSYKEGTLFLTNKDEMPWT